MRTENGPVASAPAFALLFSLCVSIHFFFDFPAPVAVLCGVFLCAAWMLLGTRRIARNYLPVFLLILFLSLIFSFSTIRRMQSAPVFPDTIETTGRVLFDRSWGKREAMLIDTQYGKIVAYAQRSQSRPAGSTVSLRAATFDFKRAEEPGAFDEFLFWHAKGARKKAILLQLTQIAPPSGLPKWRAMLEARIENRLPERMAGYMLALTTGERTTELSDLHKRAGTLHLLAVSGFHVGIFAGLCAFFFRRGRRRCFAVSLTVWLYVMLAGFPVGGVRAALMIQICLLADLFGKPSSAFNGVSAAALLMLLYNPWSYFDVGWRLSVLAALFLCAFPYAAEKYRRTLLVVSPLVWFVTAAQSAAAFKTIPLAGLFLNLAAVPLFGFLFPGVLALSLPALLGLPFAGFFAAFGEYFLEAWEIFSEAVTHFLPYTVGRSMPLFLLSAVIFAFAALRASGYSRPRSAAMLTLLPFLLLFVL